MDRITVLCMGYEEGSLSHQQTVDLFQELLEKGLVWKLQGHYGRQAEAWIREGVLALPNVSTDSNGTYHILGEMSVSSRLEDLLRENPKRELEVVNFPHQAKVLFITDCMTDLDARFYSLLSNGSVVVGYI